jgi:hypothetical protein
MAVIRNAIAAPSVADPWYTHVHTLQPTGHPSRRDLNDETDH